MKKHFLLPTIISLLFCTNLFAEQLVLERKVTNHVQRYYDKIWFDEAGTVHIFVNEFTSGSGKEKFGWAYAIQSNLLNGADGSDGTSIKSFIDEADCPLMYYIANGPFYKAGSMSDGLGEKSNKNLLIDYKKLSPHSLKQ